MSPFSFAMSVAFVGWLASCYAVKHSARFGRWRNRLIVPLWFVWMLMALGGAVVSEALPLVDAAGAGAACVVGMSSWLLMGTVFGRKRS